MKRLLIAISMVLIVLGGPAYAGSSRIASGIGYSSGAIIQGTSPFLVDTRGGVIYNMTLNATSANAFLSIYDSNSTSNPMLESPIYEIEVVTAGNTQTLDMSAAPLQTYNGIVASVVNGTAFLNVQK